MERRGGAGMGITTTRVTYTSFDTGPPSSTHTGSRNNPTVAGSTGGFIGLIAGLGIFILVALLAGLYIYNRIRRRRLARSGPSQRHSIIPSLSFSRHSDVRDPRDDPYADTAAAAAYEYDPTLTTTPGVSRPRYQRQRSSEWELPPEVSPRLSGVPLPRLDKGKGRATDLPNEPDEAAYPLRSRSPRPHSPMSSSASLPEGPFSDQETPQRAEGNPFETEAYDTRRLSPEGVYGTAVQRHDNGDDSDDDRSTIDGRSPIAGDRLDEGTRFVEKFSDTSNSSSGHVSPIARGR